MNPPLCGWCKEHGRATMENVAFEPAGSDSALTLNLNGESRPCCLDCLELVVHRYNAFGA